MRSFITEKTLICKSFVDRTSNAANAQSSEERRKFTI